MSRSRAAATVDEIIAQAGELREQLGPDQHDRFGRAAFAAVRRSADVGSLPAGPDLDRHEPIASE